MRLEELLTLLNKCQLWRVTGPLEHWLTTYNTGFWGMRMGNWDAWQRLYEGDVVLFHASAVTENVLDGVTPDERARLRSLPRGVIGLGIVGWKREKKTKEWLGEFLDQDDWPLLVDFTDIWWFGDTDGIRNEPFAKRVSFNPRTGTYRASAIVDDLIALNSNAVTFVDLELHGVRFPVQGSVSGFAEDNLAALRPVLKAHVLGLPGRGESTSPRALQSVEDVHRITSIQEVLATVEGVFDPESIQDARERIVRSVVSRRGQPQFREQLLAAYSCRCAISDCDLEAALEAAHVVPFKGPDTNHVTNGLLLRADHHTLFDMGLISVNPETMTVVLARPLEQTRYGQYANRPLHLPDDPVLHPSKAALAKHREFARL